MEVLIQDPATERIADGTDFPGFLPLDVARELQRCVIWMKASVSATDVLTLAADEQSFLLAAGYRLEFSIGGDEVVVSGVLSPARTR